MQWHDGLSEEQRLAASHWGSSARILAGPGSGKTRSLIQRVAFLMLEKQVPAQSIVVLTFTRAAAKELRERLVGHLGLPENKLPQVSTLHAFALKILLRYRVASGILVPLRVADDFEEQHIIYPELSQLIGQTPTHVKAALEAFEATWDTLDVNHEKWQSIAFRQDFEQALEKLSRFYGFTLRAELVYRLYKLFEGNPLIVEQLGIQHLLIDEYQDLNVCDQKVVGLLEDFGAQLFVVGDDDQSLYTFRHAYPHGIRQFIDGRPQCGDYLLNTCHRCPARIVELASRLIGWNGGRVDKTLQPEQLAISGNIHVLQFKDQFDEARGIAAICRAYVNAQRLQPQDISILLSRRKLAAPIVESLNEVGLSSIVLVPRWPLGNRENGNYEGRLIYCILRLMVDRQDALAARTWLGLQPKIGEQTIQGVREYCMRHHLSLWDGLLSITTDPSIVSRGAFIKTHVDSLVPLLAEYSTEETLHGILDKVVGPAEGNTDPKKGEVRAFLDQLIEANACENLGELVVTLQTYDLRAETQLDANAIRVMTMHKAKGLSAELVIIPALEDSLIPGDEDEEQVRRMLYVAFTRSRRSLILTHAALRTKEQSHLGSEQFRGEYRTKRSRFLDQLDLRSEGGQHYIRGLNDKFKQASSAQTEGISMPTARQLIIDAFSDDELMTFCFDYYTEVYNSFGMGMSKPAKVQYLLEHCYRRIAMQALLERIRNFNPNQYARFEDRLFPTP